MELKTAIRREREESLVVGTATGLPKFTERHYTIAELAELWNLSADCVRKIFEKEPDVLAVGADRPKPRARRYLTLRIPESVAQRVHRRLSVQGVSKC